MAVDVDSIIKYVLSGEGKRATGPYYSNTPFNDPTVKPLPYDPAGALALLAQAGWHRNASGMLEKAGKPLQFTLVTNNANPQRKANHDHRPRGVICGVFIVWESCCYFPAFFRTFCSAA